MQTYSNEMEKRQMQQLVQERELRSENSNYDMRKEPLNYSKPKETNSIPLPSSAEMMRKSLDKFGSSFHPTP